MQTSSYWAQNLCINALMPSDVSYEIWWKSVEAFNFSANLNFLIFPLWYQISKFLCMHEAPFVSKPKSSNILSQRKKFVKLVRKQYANSDLHAFFTFVKTFVLTKKEKINSRPHLFLFFIFINKFFKSSLLKTLLKLTVFRLKLCISPLFEKRWSDWVVDPRQRRVESHQ